MEAIILAGGLGTRLRELVPGIPKPLAPIRSRPFLEYLLDYLIAGGISGVILSIGYGGDAIRRHFQARYCSLPIRYSAETEPLGTGGAIRLALRAAETDPVCVINGDTLVQVDFRRLEDDHRRAGALMTMAVKYMRDTARYGRVRVEAGLVQSFEEGKPETGGYINAGVYVIPRTLFDGCDLPEAFSFERDFLEKQVNRLRPMACVVEGLFIDIGVPEDYERAQTELPDWR